MRRSARLAAAAVAATLLVPATAEAKIVVHAVQTSFSVVKLTGSYRSSKGSFAVQFVRRHHYALHGRITGKAFRGAIRTHQVKGHRFAARGSGRLGGRKVKIRGGGPISLKRATLILK